MSEPKRPAAPEPDRGGVEGGERDVADDRPQLEPGREGGMIDEGGAAAPRERGREGGMIGEG